MQLAGSKKQLAVRLWARGCGGPELKGQVISRIMIGLQLLDLCPAAGIVEGRLEAHCLSFRTIGKLRDRFVVWLYSFHVAISNYCYPVGCTHHDNVILCSTWWQFCYCRVVCRSPPSKCQIPYPPPKT